MNTLTIEPRFVPVQMNLMKSKRPVRRDRFRLVRILTWLRARMQTLIAELASLGVGGEKAL